MRALLLPLLRSILPLVSPLPGTGHAPWQLDRNPPTPDCSCCCSFYSMVSAAGIAQGLKSLAAGGTPPRLLIIDDGWQQTDVDPRYRQAGEWWRQYLQYQQSDAGCRLVSGGSVHWRCLQPQPQSQPQPQADCAESACCCCYPPASPAAPAACSRSAPHRGSSQRAAQPGKPRDGPPFSRQRLASCPLSVAHACQCLSAPPPAAESPQTLPCLLSCCLNLFGNPQSEVALADAVIDLLIGQDSL